VTFTVILTLPPSACSQNSRCHWSERARATSAYRKEAWAMFLQAKPRDWTRRPVKLQVHMRYGRGSRGYKPQDVQNAIGALKAAIDGMVDAGIVPDDSAQWVSWGEVSIKEEKGCVGFVAIDVLESAEIVV
jgi:crossover junction endodeoxyribonuclease RusA